MLFTSNLYTAEALLNYFCDRKDYYVELVVPLDNLKLLNRIIKEKPYCIKFIRRIKTNNGDKLGIVTNYNSEDRIRRALKVSVSNHVAAVGESKSSTLDIGLNSDVDKFIRDCNYERGT